jgi:hypothetical protein
MSVRPVFGTYFEIDISRKSVNPSHFKDFPQSLQEDHSMLPSALCYGSLVAPVKQQQLYCACHFV